jgi:DNA-binding GntR family transcriptional regulator
MPAELAPGDAGASRRVSRGIMKALESGQLTPGQRLIETDLAAKYGVGRNAVREAMQWLAAHGVIDLSRFRSASLRQLDAAETEDVLEVATAIVGLLASRAARSYSADLHKETIEESLTEIRCSDAPPETFPRARRHFYRALLDIGGNRELQRLFPAVGLHILFAQYRSAIPQRPCVDDFRAMATAIKSKDCEHAHALGRAHIRRIQTAILGQPAD